MIRIPPPFKVFVDNNSELKMNFSFFVYKNVQKSFDAMHN
jgi:hypothetical protein